MPRPSPLLPSFAGPSRWNEVFDASAAADLESDPHWCPLIGEGERPLLMHHLRDAFDLFDQDGDGALNSG
jgi:hypothetical protein